MQWGCSISSDDGLERRAWGNGQVIMAASKTQRQSALMVTMFASLLAGCSSGPLAGVANVLTPNAGAPTAPATLPEGFSAASSAPAPAAAQNPTPVVTPVASGAPLAASSSRNAPQPSSTVTRLPIQPGSPEAGDGLAALDTVQVDVFGIPDLSRSAEVDGAGTITLPLIGRVDVLGLTPEQAARNIERLYRGRYVVNPSVSVRVTQRQARTVAVTGAVTRPGVYQISGPTSLLQGLALGGGFKLEGAADTVQVLRVSGNRDLLLTYSVADIEAGRVVDPWLISGDRVIVTDNPRLVTVAGFVKTPGVYPYSGSLTLTQALALGGGQLANADPRSVNVLRTVEGRDFSTNYDIDAILAGRVTDPVVSAGDRVLVSALNQAVSVDGAVGQPTVIDWTRGLSLSRAIAQARGLGPVADRRRVAVLRMVDGQLMAAAFDLGAINSGAAPDPLLEPNDRVVVGEQRILTVMRDFAPLANIAYLLSIAGGN
jgi:polysaccharide biosynthesis/export protein